MAVGGTAWGETTMSRGEYVYRLAGCENCHTDREHGGARLAGGRKLVTPLGVFYTPNITPDKTNGIGAWSETDFKRAMREGLSPEGFHYYPSFTYTSYTRLSDADIQALWGYLRGVPAILQAEKAHQLPWYLRYRPLIAIWKWFYFKPGAYQMDGTRNAEWNRGAYLVNGAAHCNECHTPRDILGGFKKGMYLAGAAQGPEGASIPNITADKTTGIGSWKSADIVQYLQSGSRPDGDSAGSLMAELIDNGLRYLPKTDLQAIATYLMSQPAVANLVGKSKHRLAGKGRSDY
jgi:mono/diheme cytochrome c family protein